MALMLWVYADRYLLDLPDRRTSFKAVSFSHALADDGRSGTLTLYPQAHVLRVGDGADDYQCVRVFREDGLIIGTMSRSAAGEVSWRAAAL
jgi:hypothetical protein